MTQHIRCPSLGLMAAVLLALLASVQTDAEAAAPALPSVRTVIDRLNDLYRAQSSHARMTMKIVTRRFRRELALESWTRGKQVALVVVRAPAREAGSATLRTKDGLWTYAPRADRLVRIPSSLLSERWMGSHFTNDDLMRETDFVDDYDTTLAWRDHGGRRLLQATLRPKANAPVVWTQVVYTMEPEDYVPVRADYYDGDKIVRSLSFSDVRRVKGRRIPFSLEVVPTEKPDEHTKVHYQQLELDVAVDNALFSPRGLRRVAHQ